MSISNFLYKILPKEKFVKIRQWYYSIVSKIFSPLTEEKFRDFLIQKLGISKGQVVFIHSSIDKMNLGFSANTVLSILLDIVGPEGTLLFPAWQYNGNAEDYLKDNPNAVFNVIKTPTAMGLLPEIARRQKNACRSLHPTASVVAIGMHAKELLSEHHLSVYPCGEQSPYYKMLKYNSVIIGLGEKTVSLSFVHCIEDMMKEKFPVRTLNDKPLTLKVIDYEKKELDVSTLIPSKEILSRNIPRFMKKNIPENISKPIKYRGTNYYVADAKKLYDAMLNLAKDNKTIYN
jgi:aminoglycoside 3-N-acetyltransferase